MTTRPASRASGSGVEDTPANGRSPRRQSYPDLGPHVKPTAPQIPFKPCEPTEAELALPSYRKLPPLTVKRFIAAQMQVLDYMIECGREVTAGELHGYVLGRFTGDQKAAIMGALVRSGLVTVRTETPLELGDRRRRVFRIDRPEGGKR
ncbi:hypothetical protein [Singulisphaera sp. PoT]|uniref:hypothetical protein n=1 Tax=Singulisphaera sp. PoT TaxID=3411797 RepID=UPI003BF546EB